MKTQMISGVVTSVGRKWIYFCNERYPNGEDEKILINSHSQKYKTGDRVLNLLVQTEFEPKKGGGYHITHIPCSNPEKRAKLIATWWSYVKDAFEKGYIYERGVNELHSLDCFIYDKQIEEMRRELLRKKVKTTP